MEKIEELRRAIALGESLIRITDSLDQSLASVHISMALDILRAQTERVVPFSTLQDRLGAPSARE
ncbi:MAG: hypothetical protein WDN44_15455 [Sphingomonas sp.]